MSRRSEMAIESRIRRTGERGLIVLYGLIDGGPTSLQGKSLGGTVGGLYRSKLIQPKGRKDGFIIWEAVEEAVPFKELIRTTIEVVKDFKRKNNL